MKAGLDAIKVGLADMEDTSSKMTTLKDAIPGTFTTAKDNYLTQIESLRIPLENEFQKTMNAGYKQVYLTVTISSAVALLILAFYRKKKTSPVSDLA